MSRAEYSDDIDDLWQLIRWRGAVTSAFRGKRGQAFLRELLAALDAMPNKRLIRGELVEGGEVCALGAVAVARGINVEDVDPEDHKEVAATLGIADAMAREIMYENDEYFGFSLDPEVRWGRMREWVAAQIREKPEDEKSSS